MGGWVFEVLEEFQNWEVVEVGGEESSPPGSSSPQDLDDDRSPPPRVVEVLHDLEDRHQKEEGHLEVRRPPPPRVVEDGQNSIAMLVYHQNNNQSNNICYFSNHQLYKYVFLIQNTLHGLFSML